VADARRQKVGERSNFLLHLHRARPSFESGESRKKINKVGGGDEKGRKEGRQKTAGGRSGWLRLRSCVLRVPSPDRPTISVE
jgi:hypothetical protein